MTLILRPGQAVVRTLVLAVTACAVFSVTLGDASAAGQVDSLALTRKISSLERELGLATSDTFYLLLDPGAKDLTLNFRGVGLHGYRIRSLEVGRPRFRFGSSPAGPPWSEQLWTGGNLDPKRPVVRMTITPPDSADADSASTMPIPPGIEEAITVPRSFRILFGELVIVVESVGGESPRRTMKDRLRGLRQWWSDRWLPFRAPTTRVKLVLDREDAKHLFRTLPHGVSLLVRPER